jgi:hypothetical protein
LFHFCGEDEDSGFEECYGEELLGRHGDDDIDDGDYGEVKIVADETCGFLLKVS